MNKLKAYILVRDTVPSGLAVTAACHATLAMYLQFRDHEDTVAWLSPANGAFYKVVCSVNAQEFAKALELEDHVVMTESSWADGKVPTALAFRPRREWPKHFQFYRKWQGSLNDF